MILFVTALKSEANPLIKLFNLIPLKNKDFNIYKNKDIILIICGIGNINAAIATTYAISRFDIKKAINVGICGSFDKEDKPGEVFDIKKLIDHQTQKVYHLKNPKRFANSKTLYSFERPQNIITLKNALADMESIGFFLSARKFIDLKNIYILKVVSDHIDEKILEGKEVSSFIEKHNDIYQKIMYES